MLSIKDRLSAAARHRAHRRFDDAKLIYETILDAAPRNVEALLGLADASLDHGDITRTKQLVDQALRENTANPDALFASARLHLVEGNEKAAREAVDHALAARPAHPECCLLKSEFLKADGDGVAAEHILKSALATWPDDVPLKAALAQLYADYGLHAAALECIQHCLALEPARTDYISFLGRILSDLNDHAKALPYHERAYLAEAGNPVYFVHYVDAQRAVGNLSEAARLAKRAITSFPAYLPAWVAHTLTMIQMGEGEAALKSFLSVARAHRDSAEAMLMLGMCYRAAGREEHALKIALSILSRGENIDQARRDIAATLARESLLVLGRWADVPITFPKHDALSIKEDETQQDFYIPKGMRNLEAFVLARILSAQAQAQGKDKNKDAPIRLWGLSMFAPLMALLPGLTFQSLETLAEGNDDPGLDGLRNTADAGAVIDGAALPLPLIFSPKAGIIDDVETVQERLPQLVADPLRQGIWHRSMADLPRPIVGLCWDEARPGLLLADYRGLFDDFAGTILSVVWDKARHQLIDWPDIIDAGIHLDGLDVLSALIGEVDLLIGPDSIPLHIAGAMGRQALLLSQPGQPWYWHANAQQQSSWYPSVRVLTTPSCGNWGMRLQDVAPAIIAHLNAL